jgi:hypothetical protein
MSQRTSWTLRLLGVLSLAAVALAGWELAAGGLAALKRHRAPRELRGAAAPAPQAGDIASRVARVAAAERATADPSAAKKPSSAGANPTLGKAQREYLWEVEHHGLILSRHGFSRIADALKKGDLKALLALMSDDFEGFRPEAPRETEYEQDGISIRRQIDSGKPPARLDRESFAKRLLEERARFKVTPSVKLALMALAPLDHTNIDGIWQGTCQLRIFGDTGAGRPAEVLMYLRYRTPRPTEKKLSSAGWLHACSIVQHQVALAPRFLMREVAAQRGIDVKRLHDNWLGPDEIQIVPGTTTLWDYNRDGCLDLLITDINAIVLYQGRPDGTFLDVTAQVRLPRIPRLINATCVDLDGDGWEDLIFGSVLLRNHEGKFFAPADSGRTTLRPQSNVTVADYDRDGKVDLYVTALGGTKTATWVKGEGGGQTHNRLLRNLGSWQFADVTESSGASGGDRSTFSAAWLDANEDDWPDLYVINEFGNGVLLVNQHHGTFREHAIARDPGDFGSMGLTAGDFDNDGHVDLYVGNMYSKAGNRIMANLWPGSYPEPTMARLRSFTTGSQLHRNLGGLKFEPVGRELQVADVGWSYAPLLADLNNDGWLDIYATCGFMSRSRDDPDG